MKNKTRGGISVVHVIDSGGFGGGERYLLDLIRNASPGIHHAAIIPCPGPLEAGLQDLGAPYATVGMPVWPSPFAMIRIARMIRSHGSHIVHSHGYRANIYARAAALMTGAASVCTVHVSLYDYVDTPAWLRTLYITVERTTSPLTKGFICISRAMADDTARLGVGRQKIEIVPNGVDLNCFFPRKRDNTSLRGIGITRNGPVIGTVGRMVTEKGQVYLIDALAKLKSRFPDLTCLIIGQGPLLTFLKQRAEELDVLDVCTFAGVHKDIEKVYPLMDLFVLPSLREPFGLVLLEAMASGVPVVATDSGGPPDFIVSGKNGILVAPADPTAIARAVTGLLESPAWAREISAIARKTVIAKFDICKAVSRIEGIYASVWG